ncbi:hypothetical protein ACO2Q7_11445 [Rathayibacter sp. KR2-224]|uniref:hypothetical protein n=1 Tax=Rathayibacter sp. KR2-224 TaxID=3400913 RepID=UPI003C02F123
MAADSPAGWYPNPWNDAEELYWSGTEWTGISRAAHRAAPAISVPAPPDEVEEATIIRPRRTSPPLLPTPLLAPESYADAYADAGEPYADPAQRYAEPAPFFAEPVQPSAEPAQFYVEPAQSYAQPPQPSGRTGQPYVQAPPPSGEAEQRYEGQDGQSYQGAPPYQDAQPYRPAQPNQDAYYEAPDAASIRWALRDVAPAQPGNRRARLGLIAMIAGIVAAVFAVVPGLSLLAWVPAFVAIGLGIASYLGGRPRGYALAGIIEGGAALAAGTGVSIWFLVQLGALAS